MYFYNTIISIKNVYFFNIWLLLFSRKEVLMNEIKELVGLKDYKIKILKVTEIVLNNEKIKVITIVGTTKKVKCPICKKIYI